MTSRRILHLMSGSIACAKATGLTSAWVKAGHEVRVATTASVREFVGNATLEGFSGHPVLTDAFRPGQVMDHVNWARWADAVVAAPATSNLINKLAAGIADDAPTTLWQAAWGRGCPMIVVPAMNARMWAYPATRDSVARLSAWGAHVLPTADGDLACGETGAGRMLEVDDLLQRIGLLIGDVPFAARTGKRVLVTGGGTREAIDTVRFIGNASTGRTAAALADALSAAGHRVTWLGAAHAAQPERVAEREYFASYDDLAAALRRQLAGPAFDAVVHAAAVSDFSVGRIRTADDRPAAGGKLPSASAIGLELTPNPKLLDRIRGWSSRPEVRVVAFKLTDTPDAGEQRDAVARLFERAGPDVVVHNDLGEIRAGHHPFAAFRAGQKPELLDGVTGLGRWLIRWLEEQR